MFERFTDQARGVVVLAEEEARMLNHNYIGTEHILLGLLREGDAVAAQALESLEISLQAVRQQVEEIIGQGQQAYSGSIPFTPRAKNVFELSLREALQLGHHCVGTEHILLGLLREGHGVAAQILVKLGAELNRVRQQVIGLLSGQQPQPGRQQPREDAPVTEVQARLEQLEGRRPPPEGTWVTGAQARLDAVEGRLTAVEQRVGIRPDTSDLDEQIDRVRGERHAAADAQEYERAASLRDREKELLASKAARQEQWAAGHPALPVLAERCQQLADEIERLGAVLRQHGIDPQDKPA